MTAALKEEQIDQLFYALSDRTRRQMLKALTGGAQIVSELGSPFGISKQAVSKHLQVLEEAKLISKEKEGRIQRCSINPEMLQMVEEIVAEYRQFWNQQLSALDDYIESTKKKERKS